MLELDLQDAIEAIFAEDQWLSANTNGIYLEGTEGDPGYPYAIYSMECEGSNKAVTPETEVRLTFTVFADARKSAGQTIGAANALDHIKTTFLGRKIEMADYDNFIPPMLGGNSGRVELDADRRWIGTITFNLSVA